MKMTEQVKPSDEKLFSEKVTKAADPKIHLTSFEILHFSSR